MGTTYQASSKAADAPDIEGGVYDGLFKGTSPKLVLGGQYGPGTILNIDGSAFDASKGAPVDGKQFNKLEWSFLLIDEAGEPFVDDKSDKDIYVQKLTGHGFNIAAKTTPAEVLVLKALMTAAEFAAFEAGDAVDEDALLDRKVQLEVFVKDSGWPGVDKVIAPRVARTAKGRKAVEE